MISVTLVDTVSTNSAQISNYLPPTTENDSAEEYDSDSDSEDGVGGGGDGSVVDEVVRENADNVPHSFVRPHHPTGISKRLCMRILTVTLIRCMSCVLS